MADTSSRVSRELSSVGFDQLTTLTVAVICVGVFTLLVSFALAASLLFKLRRSRREESLGPEQRIAAESQAAEADAPDLEASVSADARLEAETETPTPSNSELADGSASAAEAQAQSFGVPFHVRVQNALQITAELETAVAHAGHPAATQHTSTDNHCAGESEEGGISEETDCFASMDLKGIVELGVAEQWYIFDDQVVLESASVLEGAFASVRRGMLFGSHQVAVKVPKSFRNDLSGAAALANEIRLYRRIRHPNIVLCYGVTILSLPSPLPCLVLEWVDGGNLSTFVLARRASRDFLRESKDIFSTDEARRDLSNLKFLKETKLLTDVAWGMQYLHAQKPAILHMDLKPQNILIEVADPPAAKLADFGLAILLDHDARKSNVGTARYMAPEVQQQNRTYHKPAEVYSFGLTVAFTISGQHPPKAKKGGVSLLHKQMVQMLQTPHLPRKLVKIITRCLSPRPSSRPNFAELCLLLGGTGAASPSAEGGSQLQNSIDKSQNQSLSTAYTVPESSTGSDSSFSLTLSDRDLSGLSSLSGARIDKKAKESKEGSHAGSDLSDKEPNMRSNHKKDAMRCSL